MTRAISAILTRKRHIYGDNLFGINFATAEGYDVNFMFAEQGIPFISGITGVSKEEESGLVKCVEASEINAVIDKNMNPALVLMGAMLRYASVQFPNALEGFSGYGIDSHQMGKKDEISGTMVKWADYFKADRTAKFGHGYHDIKLMGPDGTTELNFGTKVLGRDSYADFTIKRALPFLVGKDKDKGLVYSMEDVLSE